MPGPRYCILCGESFHGGRVDLRYCGANCRTRACRMRRRGEPIHEKCAPQPMSLASLLSDGLPCPCCGVRIVMHVTTTQAGVPDGHTTAAIPKGPASAEYRSSQGASRPVAKKTSQDASLSHPKVQAAARSPLPLAEEDHAPARLLTGPPDALVAHRAPPTAPVGPKVARHPPITPAVPRRQDEPQAAVSSPIPSGIFSQQHLWLPCYQDVSERPAVYILAAAETKLRGDPWLGSGHVLVRMSVLRPLMSLTGVTSGKSARI